MVWDSLIDYGRLNGNGLSMTWNKLPSVAYENVLNEFDSVLYVKGLISICNIR